MSSKSGGARLRQGQLLANRYYIVAEIGRGGMGSIYRAKDNTLKEDVALKTLLPQFIQDKHVVERFFNEARIARTLSHPNIVRVHDIGASQGTVYISMELLTGKSLRQLLEGLMPGDRLPMRTVLDIFDQLCAALEYAHRYTVHRDLKPENVMVMEDGSVKLMDFGISKLMGDASLTSASMVMGTPHYMPPEQVKHSAGVDQRADLYSLGVMLYETITGNLPTAIHKPVSKIVRGVPPSLDPIIETCLQDDPNRRYGSAGELRAAIGAVREQLGFTQGASNYRPRLPRQRLIGEPRRAIGYVLLLLLLAGTGYGVWLAEQTRERLVAEGAMLPPLQNQPDDPGADSEPATVVNAPLTLESALSLLPPARAQADSVARGLPEGPLKAHRALLLEEARTWENAVSDYAESDPRVALPAARRALHLYLAVIHWPEQAFFVPPSEAEAGFFVDNRPATKASFSQFVERQDWRLPDSANRLSDADSMLFVTWYDARAYLAGQEKLAELPTEWQWGRALDHARATGGLRWIGEPEPEVQSSSGTNEEGTEGAEVVPAWTPEFWADNGLLEWTRDASELNSDEQPSFGDTMIVRGAARTEGEIAALKDALPFEHASEMVGFRGVWTLPMTEAGVKSLL